MAAGYLLQFTPSCRPRGLAFLVSRLAAVLPLVGAYKADPPAAGQAVLAQWRARIRRLDAYGWDLTRTRATGKSGSRVAHGRKWRMLNCPPAAFLAEPRSLPCNTTAICPHCWGRAAALQWRALDLRLFGPSRSRTTRTALPDIRPRNLRDTALVCRRLTIPVPYQDFHGSSPLRSALKRRICRGVTADAFTIQVPTRKAEFRQLVAVGGQGGLEIVRVRPAPVPPAANAPARAAAGWILEVRQVVVVAADQLETFVAADKTSRAPLAPAPIIAPTRVQLALAVAWACRYPRFLLHGPPAAAIAVLQAQKGLKLIARFGSCRGC